MALVCLCRGNFYWPPHTTILFCSIFLDKIVLDTLKSRYHRSAPLGMLPMFLLAMYEKNGQPLEVIIRQFVEVKFLRPKERPYQTNNFYTALARQERLDKEVRAIVKGKGKDPKQKA